MTGFARARLMLPISDSLGRERRIEDGFITWKGGVISEVGAYDEEVGRRLLKEHGELEVLAHSGTRAVSTLEGLTALPGILMPGFVKCHGHDYEPPLIGLVKDVPLTAWLDGAVNVFTKFIGERCADLTAMLGEDPHDVAYKKARLDDLSYGITTSMVHHCNYGKYSVDKLADANELAGTRMVIAVGGQDRNYFEELLDTVEEAIERLDRYTANHADRSRVTIIPGPDQLFSNGPEMLKATKAWARENGTIFHCHSSEEAKTTAWFKSEYGQSPVEYAASIGILDEGTILAHQVQTTEDDLKLLAETGTRIVHNPLANTILGSGMPPLLEMLERGIKVAIATDGSGSADNQNILAAARLASQYQKAFRKDASVLPAQQVLEMITAEAGALLNMKVGQLRQGYAADFIHISTEPLNLFPTRACNAMENLIWCANGDEIDLVVVGGRILRSGAQNETIDEVEVRARLARLCDEFDKYRETVKLNLKGTGANR